MPNDETMYELRQGHEGRRRDSSFETRDGALEWTDDELPWRRRWLWRLLAAGAGIGGLLTLAGLNHQ